MHVLGFEHTSITVVPDLGHPMINRKGENCFTIPIELRNKTFRPFHDGIYDFDALRVFVSPENRVGCSRGEREVLTRECGRCEWLVTSKPRSYGLFSAQS